MSGMPLFHAFLLGASVILLIVATQSRHLHPFLAIVAIASAFGLAAGLSISLLGKAFGTGFSQAIYSPGLVLVGAGFVAGLTESTAASDRLMAKIDQRRSWLGFTRLAALLGLVAGIAASPAAAFALLTPLIRPIGGETAHKRKAASIALALAISASHGLVFLAPVPIAAAFILGARWDRVALFGLPVALLSVVIAAVLARWLSAVAVASPPFTNGLYPAAEKRSGGSAFVLVLATAVPLLMLMVQSLGDIPSEPLGGGSSRELVLGIGRPLILLLVGLGIMIIVHWRPSLGLLADSTWTERILGNVAGILLTVGAAGGLQRLCQETGMAELLGERLLRWHFGGLGGLLVPFLTAALIKTLQGSSLVAAITTAGMIQPMLAPLGIGGENEMALATLAVGAGAMTISHVNDDFFWLVTGSAGIRSLHGLATVTVGTLLQGLAAVAALLILSVLVSSV
jgi:gluconate:H+ symporter, GntP family